MGGGERKNGGGGGERQTQRVMKRENTDTRGRGGGKGGEGHGHKGKDTDMRVGGRGGREFIAKERRKHGRHAAHVRDNRDIIHLKNNIHGGIAG